MLKLTKKEVAIQYWQDLYNKIGKDRHDAHVWLTYTLGSNDGRLFLCARTDKAERTLLRMSAKAFNWFELEELESPYINERRYRIVKLLDKSTTGKVPESHTVGLLKYLY